MYRAMGRTPSCTTASSNPGSRTSRNPSLPRRSRAACGTRSTRSAAMARILVIDDDALLRGAIRVVLESAGYEVIEAGDGNAALRVYREDRKSTRLNSSHSQISYAVFCLKKKSI